MRTMVAVERMLDTSGIDLAIQAGMLVFGLAAMGFSWWLVEQDPYAAPLAVFLGGGGLAMAGLAVVAFFVGVH